MTSNSFWEPGSPVEPLARHLAEGGVIAFPTESSYALGADPRNPRGVDAIYRLKERERGKALPVVVAGRTQLEALGLEISGSAVEAAARFWPAALTIVLPLALPIAASAGDGTLAVRVPDHEGVRALLTALGHGLTATSANRSGEAPLLDPVEVARWLAPVGVPIVGGPPLPGGAPSTLIAPAAGGERLVVLRTGRFDPHRLAPWLA
jgi:L-threonylcarbamoyladenylate synthase